MASRFWANGVWKGTELAADWVNPKNDGMGFWLDMQVGAGLLERGRRADGEIAYKMNEQGVKYRRNQNAQEDEVIDEPQIMTLGEIADFLKVHRSTLYRLIKQRKLPVFRIGSDYRARRSGPDGMDAGADR